MEMLFKVNVRLKDNVSSACGQGMMVELNLKVGVSKSSVKALMDAS